jgi:hypothetical protein
LDGGDLKMDDKELLEKYVKVVWCNDTMCWWHIEVAEKYFVDRGKNHKPFTDDAFIGICSRKDIGLAPQKIWDKTNKTTLQRFTSCRVRSDKSLNEPHFPDPDKIQQHDIEDLKGPDWTHSAYGSR